MLCRGRHVEIRRYLPRRQGDTFFVQRSGSSTFDELTVTHLQENGLWISMDPEEAAAAAIFDVGLDQIFPMGVEGGLPRDGGRLGGCVLRMGRVFSERARDQVFAETAEIALTHGAAPLAPPELLPPGAPTWDFTTSEGGRGHWPRPRPLATRPRPPSGCSADADVDRPVAGSVGGPDKGCWFLAEPREGYEVGTDVTTDVLAGAVTGLRPLVLLQGIWVHAVSMADTIEYMSKTAAADAENLEQQRMALVLRQPEIE